MKKRRLESYSKPTRPNTLKEQYGRGLKWKKITLGPYTILKYEDGGLLIWASHVLGYLYSGRLTDTIMDYIWFNHEYLVFIDNKGWILMLENKTIPFNHLKPLHGGLFRLSPQKIVSLHYGNRHGFLVFTTKDHYIHIFDQNLEHYYGSERFKYAIPYIEFTVANRFYVYQRDHARKALNLVNKTDLVKRHISFFLDHDITFDAFYWVF